MKSTAMERLEARLRSTVSPRALILNEADTLVNRIEELENLLLDVNQQMNNLWNRADAENRALTDDEREEIDKLGAQSDMIEDELEMRRAQEERNARLAEPRGRVTDPDDPTHEPGLDTRNAPQPRRQGEAGRRRVPAQPIDRAEIDRHSFNHMGEFAVSVMRACQPGPRALDPRLVRNAPTTVTREGVGEDGGFLVPPEFRREVMRKVMGEASLLGRTDGQTSSSNVFTFPKDETTPWQSSGGVQAYWEGENDQLTQSKINLGQETLRLNKLTALVPVTEEMLSDAPSVDRYLRMKVPEKFDFKINDALINGDGAGKPKGLLNADCLVTVAKESGQVASTVLFNNIINMWARLYAGCRANAVWLINQDIEPQLFSLAFPTTVTTAAVPMYMPPGGLSAAPYGTIMGRPVLPTEACQTLGTAGDIILTDLSKYLTVTKTEGMRADVSMHLWFDYDTTAFRFILRLAGQNWWGSAITPFNASNTLSCAVALATRS